MEWWGLVFIWLAFGLLIGIWRVRKETICGTYGLEVDVGMSTFAIFMAILLILFCFHSEAENTTYDYRNKTAIYSVEDNVGISGQIDGSFALGFGTISGQTNTDLYYFVMIGDGENGYVVTKYNASETYLIPEENENPYYIERYALCEKEEYPFGKMLTKPSISNTETLNRRELHIPRNYIKQKISIDMK